MSLGSSGSPSARASVTVVIPTFENAATIGDAVRAVVPQADEVLVVDDASADGTADVARAHGARVLTVRGRSAAHARNVGWEAARHDVVLFTDSDAVPEPGWAAALRRAFDDPSVDVAGGPIANASRGRFARAYHRMYLLTDGRQFRDGSTHLPGMNLAVRKRLLDVVRFRDDLPGARCEDVDFLLRARAAGVHARFVPDAVVAHRQPATLPDLVEQELRHGRGRADLVALHPDLARPWHTDRYWKWLLMSLPGAPAHLLWGVRTARTLDPAVLGLHVLRMAIGDYGYWQRAREIRARGGLTPARAAPAPAPRR